MNVLMMSLSFMKSDLKSMYDFKEHARNLKEKASALKVEIPTILLALKDKNTPILAKLFGALSIAYALSPIDLIPDFIPILGYLDDIILLPLLVTITLKLIPKDVYQACRVQAQTLYENGYSKKWFYAIPVFLIWFFILCIILRLVC